jgi:hypothetical protein
MFLSYIQIIGLICLAQDNAVQAITLLAIRTVIRNGGFQRVIEKPAKFGE